MDELARDQPLPAWLTEGLAQYYEYEIGLVGGRPDATKWRTFPSADEARAAASSGGLIPLPSLESRASWNSQTDADRISLQYSGSYMAVRYLIETYGAEAAVDIVLETGGRFNLASAIQNILGLPYVQFEQQIVAWLEGWEDTERGEISPYIEILDGILESASAITQRRANELLSNTQRIQRIRFNRILHSDAQTLENELKEVTPPISLADLHQEALSYLDRYVQWLALELEHVETGVDAKRVEANNMIEEINVREVLLARGIIDVKFIYDLGE